MHIGLIGGIGPAATDYYYRRLIAAFATKGAPLDLTIVHADTPTLLGNLAANDVSAQVAIYVRLTKRLVAAGAGCVVVTSIAGHFCIEAFKEACPLPVIDLIEHVEGEILSLGVRRIGVLGTRTVMATGVYGRIKAAELIAPAGADLENVHTAYVAMAAAGVVTDDQRAVFNAASQRLLTEGGAEAILLGGTDLALVFNAAETPFPIIDCAAIHADAVARQATGEA
jgi:aspartate racemase